MVINYFWSNFLRSSTKILCSSTKNSLNENVITVNLSFFVRYRYRPVSVTVTMNEMVTMTVTMTVTATVTVTVTLNFLKQILFAKMFEISINNNPNRSDGHKS
jgi:hypothetical protein